MDRLSKVCLLIIIVLLVVIAVRPIVGPQPAIAAVHYQYLVVQTTAWTNDLQAEVTKHAAEGWELAAPIVTEQMPGIILIFRKEAR